MNLLVMSIVRIRSGFECSSVQLAKPVHVSPLHTEAIAVIHIPSTYFSLKGFEVIYKWQKEYLISDCIHELSSPSQIVKPLLSLLLTLMQHMGSLGFHRWRSVCIC